MRIKNFTLMLVAVLFSAVGFAQKSFTSQKDIAINRQAKTETLVMQNSFKSAFAANQQSASASSHRAKARAQSPELVTPPEKGYLEYYTLTGTNSKDGAATRQIKVIWDDKDEDVVYVSGLSYYMPKSYVKGVFNKAGDQVTFSAGQYMGNPGVDLYFGGYGDGKALSDVVADFDEKKSTFTFSDYLLDNGDPRELGFYAYWQPGVIISPLEGDPEIPVEVPRDLEIETYAYTAYDYFEDAEVSGNVNVGIYGEEVYIQGMSTDYPEAWIKGAFTDERTVVFKSGQLLTDERSLYFVAIDNNFDVTDEYILIYDPETGNFEEGDYAALINSYKDKIDRSVWQFYYGYEIKRITEKAATPAKSLVSAVRYMPDGDYLEFTLSKVDTDGEGMVAEKLSYKLYYQDEAGDAFPVTLSAGDYENLKEDMAEIPATFTDDADIKDGKLKLNMEHNSSWVKIGIQGVYYGGEERHESEIAWYTPTWPKSFTMPEGLTVTEHTFEGVKTSGGAVEGTVGIAFDGDDMYIRGLGQTNEDIWVKGTKNAEGDYVFPNGQDLGLYYDEDRLFFLGYTDETFTDPVLKVDNASGVYEFVTEVVENADYTDKGYYVTWLNAGAIIYMAEAGEEVYEPVSVPENLETEVWSFSATDYFDEVPVSRSLQVGFDGEDVYVQGLSEYLPEAWVKGQVVEDQISFKTGQYLGEYSGEDMWFIGYNMNSGISDYVMTYDEETFTMSNPSEDELIGINVYKNKVQQSLYEFYYTASIKRVTEKIATPATPSISHMNFSVYGDVAEFSIPTVDVDGDGLITDLLSYKLYYDEGDGEAKEVTFTTDLYKYLEEDMTVIPYGFVDYEDEEGNQGYDFLPSKVYLNMEHDTWTRVGIQSIYTGGGETNASEIGWYTPAWPQTIELPEGAEVTTYSFQGSYYNSSGNVDFTKAVNVAMVGDDVYVQGIGRESESAWIKGTKSPETNTYTFANGQRLGLLELQNDYSYLFLLGYNSMFGVVDAKMTYDEETGIFTTTTEFVENADYTDKLYYWTRINAGAQIKPVDGNTPAVPATPSIDHINFSVYGEIAEFTIPVQSVDGQPIVAEQLAYKLYYDEGDGEAKEITFTTDLYECLQEDMTVIPYGFLDDEDEEGNPQGYDFYEDGVYLNMGTKGWTRVGIQTLYTAGDETNASEIGWYTITQPQLVELPDGAEVTKYGFLGKDLKGVEFTKVVNVAKVGDDVYVQGIGSVDSETWIRGTKDDANNYTFTNGQYLGYYDGRYPSFLFLLGFVDGVGVTDLTMSYDEETGIFTTTSYLVENADYTDKLYYLSVIAPGAQLIPGDNPDAIDTVAAEAEEDAARYNIAGQRVGKNYKGIVVEKGIKFFQK